MPEWFCSAGAHFYVSGRDGTEFAQLLSPFPCCSNGQDWTVRLKDYAKFLKLNTDCCAHNENLMKREIKMFGYRQKRVKISECDKVDGDDDPTPQILAVDTLWCQDRNNCPWFAGKNLLTLEEKILLVFLCKMHTSCLWWQNQEFIYSYPITVTQNGIRQHEIIFQINMRALRKSTVLSKNLRNNDCTYYKRFQTPQSLQFECLLRKFFHCKNNSRFGLDKISTLEMLSLNHSSLRNPSFPSTFDDLRLRKKIRSMFTKAYWELHFPYPNPLTKTKIKRCERNTGMDLFSVRQQRRSNTSRSISRIAAKPSIKKIAKKTVTIIPPCSQLFIRVRQ